MNNQYKYYVFNTIENKIFSGWEFKADAKDSLKEYRGLDLDFVYHSKVFTRSYLENSLKIDTNNLNNWSK